jgi:hypothetical protein
MGIYNLIHNSNDDLYFYCPVNDCPCHQPDYYDSSRNNYNNIYFNIDDYDSSNSRPNNHNGTTTNNNNNPKNVFNGDLN